MPTTAHKRAKQLKAEIISDPIAKLETMSLPLRFILHTSSFFLTSAASFHVRHFLFFFVQFKQTARAFEDLLSIRLPSKLKIKSKLRITCDAKN